MKKVLKLLVVVLFIILVFVTAMIVFNNSANDEALPLNTVVKNMLAESGIQKSKITYFYEESNETQEVFKSKEIEISNEDLQKYINDILISHEKMIEITDRDVVRQNDAIIVSYVVYYGDEMVASVKGDPLMVGSGNYFEDFETAVIGAKVGEPFVFELNSPIDTEKYKKGATLKYNVTVESINYFESYTDSDKYILDYYGVNSKDEFWAQCKMRLKKIKQYENSILEQNEFLDKISEKCEFFIDKNEAAEYSKRIVEQQKALAQMSGLDLQEYIEKNLNMTEDEFYDFCYAEGEKEIKRYLVVGAYSDDIIFYDDFGTRSDYKEFCSINGYDSNLKDEQDSKYEYLKTFMRNHFYKNFDPLTLVFVKMDLESTSVKVFKTSNKYTVDYGNGESEIKSELLKNDIINAACDLEFGCSDYEEKSFKSLYDTVIVFDTLEDGKIVWEIDTVNGYIKWEKDDNVYCCILPNSFSQLINNR